MKRSRDESERPTQQTKQPQLEAHVGPTGQMLTPNDAFSYLNLVKDAFQDKKPIYNQFLELMKDYKCQRINAAGVAERVKVLFQGNQDLMLGFNTFLPAKYAIKLPLEVPAKKAAERKEAFNFINKIKVRFRSEDHIYHLFLEILNQFRIGQKSSDEVYKEVCVLFRNHPDLCEEFAEFLPDSRVAADSCNAASVKNTASPALGGNLERTNGLSVDNGLDPDPGRFLKLEERKLNEKHRSGKEGENGSKDFELDDNMQQLPNNHNNARKIKREGSDKLLSTATLPSSFSGEEAKGVLHQDILFCDEVRKRMQRPADFPQFLKCLHIYSNHLITRKELLNLVADFIGHESDLLARFPDFLTHCKSIDECLAFYSSNQQRSEENGADSVKPKDRDRERERNPGFGNRDNMAQKVHSYASKDKYMAKPISELDLSNCERCTPSYRLLPVDYPIPTASQRSSLGSQVLNDHWVSVTSGSEDYSFKHMRKNQYEESLFRCEDDRFELDMLLESVNMTIKGVEELQAKIDSHSLLLGQPLRIEDHLKALSLRTIERLYGDHANDVMEVLKKNAALALPVVYTRLKQKQEEWLRCRAEFNQVWAEIYAKNYHKSLDHRSFYFKQQDTKSLSTKALLLEIKELSENSRKEDSLLDAHNAWSRMPLKPNLTFEYPDPDIHEDMYQLVKYSCAEVCTPEQLEKAMNIWISFIEPMLGVPPRPDDPEDSEDAANSNSHGSRGAASPTSDSDCSPEGYSVKDADLASPLKAGNTPELSTISEGRLVERVKEDISLDHSPSKNDSTSASRSLARVHHDVVMVNNISGAMKQTCLNEWATDASLTIEARENKETNRGTTSDGFVMITRESSSPVADGNIRKQCNGMTPLQVVDEGDRSRTPTDSTVDRHHEECAGNGKPDREEGELSPTGDLGEDNFAVYAEAPVDDASETNCNTTSRAQLNPVENTHNEAAEAGLDHQSEETPQRSSEDSDNASDNGEASGSDLVEECFRENEGANNGRNDSKAESEDGVKETDDDVHEVDGEGNSIPISELALSNVKPLVKHVPLALQERKNSSRVFYGNDSLYVLLRLHQTLYGRIRSAKINSSSVEKKWKSLTDNSSTSSTDQYARFMSALYSLIDGSSDNTKFEDDCRAIIGTQSYVLFTLDKLIFKLVKQLQTVSGDETDNKLLQLYAYENSRKPDRFVDGVYHENARVLLHDGNIYRMECWSPSCQLSIQLMDHSLVKPELTAVSIEPKFSSYLHDDFLGVNPDRKAKSGIFMKRNKRKMMRGNESMDERIRIFNGLECKINCKTSKVSYVFDTTDVLYRRPFRMSQALHPDMKAKMHALKSVRSHRLRKLFKSPH